MRDSAAKQGKEADDERDVRRHRDAPAGNRRLPPLEREVNGRRHDHSAQGRHDRKSCLA